MMQPVEAILFDMGGTLRRSRKRSREERLSYVAEILKLLGLEGDPARFSRLLARRSSAYRTWARQTMVELSETELWVRWLLPDQPKDLVHTHTMQLNRLWRDATGERIVFPEAAMVIRELFRRGYRLGLVSNTTSSTEAPDVLQQLGLTGYFETMILSTVVGKRKPDPNILLEATGRMEIAPEKCAYVGDMPHRDVDAARQAGFAHAILVHHRSRRSAPPVAAPHLQPDANIRDLRELLDLFPPRTPPQPAQVFPVSVSTMWAMKSFATLDDFIEAGRRIGFGAVELNHQVNTELLNTVSINGHTISSVHEPCPADIAAPVLRDRNWLMSATDEASRCQGVQAIRRSIELAGQLGARVVVIHSGTVDPDRSLEEHLRHLYGAGQTGTDEYRQVQAAIIQKRGELAPAGFAAVKKSVSELLEHAEHYGVRLGLENRYHYLEFPSPDEMEQLLQLAGPDRLGFIYDVGHAQALARLGFYPYDEWLKRFGPRIVETHLHDVIGLRDHQPPGQGVVDFRVIGSYLPEDAIRTFEFQGSLTQEQVKASLKHLSNCGCFTHKPAWRS